MGMSSKNKRASPAWAPMVLREGSFFSCTCSFFHELFEAPCTLRQVHGMQQEHANPQFYTEFNGLGVIHDQEAR